MSMSHPTDLENEKKSKKKSPIGRGGIQLYTLSITYS